MNLPRCAVSKDGDHWHCQYRSVEECLTEDLVAGDRGFRNPNPYFVAGPAESGRSEKRRVRQQ